MKEAVAFIGAVAALVSAVAAYQSGASSGQADCSAVLVPIIETYAETCSGCSGSD